MNNNLYYYSTNTSLSYLISKMFYDSTFYVWCSPVFDPQTLDTYNPFKRIPKSSSPYAIYLEYMKDIESGDSHSAKIELNKKGLKSGAAIALANGIINKEEHNKIEYIIDKAELNDFKPILYVIHAEKVCDRIKKVEVSKTANPLSTEYILEDLKIEEFEIIQF